MNLAQTTRSAVFLDKDGTLLENVPYNVDTSLMNFAPGAREALRKIQEAGYPLFVISNQSGVARGMFKEEALLPVRQHLQEMLRDQGVRLDGFYYCPHYPQGSVSQYSMTCFCRKPSPGMLFRAAREHALDLSNSWFIGDILDDIECGRRGNCRTILIDHGGETEWKGGPMRQPHYTVSSLVEAAQIILENIRIPFPTRFAKDPVANTKDRS